MEFTGPIITVLTVVVAQWIATKNVQRTIDANAKLQIERNKQSHRIELFKELLQYLNTATYETLQASSWTEHVHLAIKNWTARGVSPDHATAESLEIEKRINETRFKAGIATSRFFGAMKQNKIAFERPGSIDLYLELMFVVQTDLRQASSELADAIQLCRQEYLSHNTVNAANTTKVWVSAAKYIELSVEEADFLVDFGVQIQNALLSPVYDGRTVEFRKPRNPEGIVLRDDLKDNLERIKQRIRNATDKYQCP